MIEISKIDAARRQLATAICLHFACGDSISVYSLATNAWEIIDELCRLKSVDSLSVKSRENVPLGRDLKLHYINSPYRNFFKHANNDPDAMLPEMESERVDGILFLATDDYIRLLNKSPVELQVFQLWYLALYTSKVHPKLLEEVVNVAESVFPKMQELTRAEQLALGQHVLKDFKRDQSLRDDPRTELAFNV